MAKKIDTIKTKKCAESYLDFLQNKNLESYFLYKKAYNKLNEDEKFLVILDITVLKEIIKDEPKGE